MKKENAVIFGVTGVVFAAALIGGGIYMKTERDRNLNADTASTAADSNRAEEVQKAVDSVKKTPNPIETMDEDTEVSLGFDKEKLYKNMVDARADWLYELPQWEKIFDENTRKRLYKEQKNSGTIRKEKKIGRNDPCPCGSGKKYKKCCGRNA